MIARNVRRLALWIAAAALLAHAGLLAGGVWSFEALNYDDGQVLEIVQRTSVDDLVTQATWYAYKPIYFLSLKIDTLFGTAAVGVGHVVNLLLHALAAFLLVLLLFDVFGSRWIAGAAGLLFAVHPAHAENVAWLAERKDMLSLLFVLAAHRSWRARRSQPTSAVWLPVLLLLLGGLTKGTVWSYAGILVVDEWLARRGRPAPRPSRAWGRVLPLLLVAAGGVVMDALVAFSSGAGGVEHGVSTLSLAAASAGVHLRYLLSLLAPVGLALDHAIRPGGSWASPQAWGGVLLALGALVLLVRGLRAGRALPALAASFWIFGLLPVNNVWPRTAVLMADRYLYVPAIGLYVLLAWALARAGRGRGWILGLAAVLLAILCEARTASFASSERVWTDTIATVPHSALAHIQRGQALAAAQAYERAQQDADAAIALAPRPELLVRAHLLRCAALLGQGGSDTLLAAANTASLLARNLRREALVRDDPSAMQAQAEIFRGQALERLGDPITALDAYRRAVTLDDQNWSAHYNVGTVLAGLQTETALEESVDALRRAVSLNPGYLEASLQLATVYGRRGDKPRALLVLERAEQRHGRAPDLLYARATIHLEVGNDWQQARNILRELRELDPQHPKGQRLEADIEVAIGRAALARGRGERDREMLRRAVEHFDLALRILPGHWQANLYAGDALGEQGRFGEARARYRAARSQAPRERWIEGVMARTAVLEAAVAARTAQGHADLERAAGIMAAAVGLDVGRIDLGFAPFEEELGWLRGVAAVLERNRAPESDQAAALLSIAALLVSGDEMTALSDLQDVFARLGGAEREPALLDAALLLRAMLYERQADFDAARRDYELLARRRGSDLLPPLRLLQIDLRSAQARLTIARGFPDDTRKLAEAQAEVSRTAEAARTFADEHPESSNAGLLAVQSEIGLERWIEALRRLNDLAQRFPRNASVLRGFNLVYVAWYKSTNDVGLLKEADRVMRRAIESDPRDVRTLTDASQLARVAGDLNQALRYARDARREERRTGGPASRMLGDLHVELGLKALEGSQVEAVRQAIDAARKVDPTRAGSWLLEGKLLLAAPAKDRYEKAYAMALKAKELDPFNPAVRRLLAECHRGRATSYLMTMGAVRAPGKGSRQYDAWSQLDPEEQAKRLAAAKADLRAQAIAELNASLVQDPDGEEAKDTQRMVEQLLEASPENRHERVQQAQAAYERGRAHQDAGEGLDALYAYGEAVGFNPRHGRAHFHLLQVAEALLHGLPTETPEGKQAADRYLEMGFRSLHALDALDTERRFAELWYYRGLLHVWIHGSDTTKDARDVSRRAAIKAFENFLMLKGAAGETPETSPAMENATVRLRLLQQEED